jgi:hypothetical protein
MMLAAAELSIGITKRCVAMPSRWPQFPPSFMREEPPYPIVEGPLREPGRMRVFEEKY